MMDSSRSFVITKITLLCVKVIDTLLERGIKLLGSFKRIIEELRGNVDSNLDEEFASAKFENI